MSGGGRDWLFDEEPKRKRKHGNPVSIIVNADAKHPFRLHDKEDKAIGYAKGMFSISETRSVKVVSGGKVIWGRNRDEEISG